MHGKIPTTTKTKTAKTMAAAAKNEHCLSCGYHYNNENECAVEQFFSHFLIKLLSFLNAHSTNGYWYGSWIMDMLNGLFKWAVDIFSNYFSQQIGILKWNMNKLRENHSTLTTSMFYSMYTKYRYTYTNILPTQSRTNWLRWAWNFPPMFYWALPIPEPTLHHFLLRRFFSVHFMCIEYTRETSQQIIRYSNRMLDEWIKANPS